MKHVLILIAASMLFACAPSEPVKISSIETIGADTSTTKPPKASLDDFKILVGDNWSGSLNYLNYGSDKRSTIPANLEINLKGERKIKYKIIFPKEPNSNSSDTISISKDGSKLDGQIITDRSIDEDGSLVLTAQSRDYDDNQEADIRTTYTISEREFRMKKDVKFDNDEDFLNRNEFVFTR